MMNKIINILRYIFLGIMIIIFIPFIVLIFLLSLPFVILGLIADDFSG